MHSRSCSCSCIFRAAKATSEGGTSEASRARAGFTSSGVAGLETDGEGAVDGGQDEVGSEVVALARDACRAYFSKKSVNNVDLFF